MMEKTCRNCANPLSGNFCSNCGQSASIGRINLHSIIHEFLHGVLHVDKGIFYTMKELTLRPGVILRGYLDGKRVRLFKPFSYLFILATVYILLMKFFELSIAKVSLVAVEAQDKGEELVKMTENLTNRVFGFMNDHYAFLSLLILPIMAFCTYLFFRKMKFNYGEHLILNAYISGHVLLLNILLIPFAYFYPGSSSTISMVTWLLGVYMYVKVFDDYGLFYRILRSVFCYLTLTIITAAITIMLLALLVIKPYLF